MANPRYQLQKYVGERQAQDARKLAFGRSELDDMVQQVYSANALPKHAAVEIQNCTNVSCVLIILYFNGFETQPAAIGLVAVAMEDIKANAYVAPCYGELVLCVFHRFFTSFQTY